MAAALIAPPGPAGRPGSAPVSAQGPGPVVPPVCGSVSSFDWGDNTGPVDGVAIEAQDVQVTTAVTDPSAVLLSAQAQADSLGGQAGYLRLDARGNQVGSVATVTLAWSEPVPRIDVTLVDIDAGAGWIDVVRVRAFLGATEVTSATQPTLGGTAVTQTGSAPLEFTGAASASVNQVTGNVRLQVPVFADRLVIDYGDGPGASTRAIGIGDPSWCGPVVGAAKDGPPQPLALGGGLFSIDYRVTVANLGGTELHDVVVSDELAGAFGEAVADVAAVDGPGLYHVSDPVLVANAADPLAADPAYDGDGAVGLVVPATGVLLPGEAIVIAFTVTFLPAQDGVDLVVANQAAAAADTRLHADGQSDADTADLSDGGTAPDPDGDGDPAEAGEDDPTTSTIPAPAPAISLSKELAANTDEDGSGEVSAGDTLRFALGVTNTGNVPLTAVSVVDDTADAPVSCPAQELDVGGSMSCSAPYTVTQADADAGGFTNSAVVEASDPSGATVRSAAELMLEIPERAGVELTKALTSAIAAGDGTVDLTFLLVITNTGTTTLRDIAVTDAVLDLMAGLSPTDVAAADGSLDASPSWSGQALAPGGSGSVSVRFSVTPGAVTRAVNEASVSATSVLGSAVQAEAGATVDFVEAPGLVVVASQGGRELARARTASPYRFTDLPAGPVLLRLDPASLPAGVLAGIDADTTADLSTVVAVEAGRTSAAVDFALIPRFDVSVVKEAVGIAGDLATWRITLRSAGPGPAPGPTTVVDTLPAGVALVSATGPGWQCAAAGPPGPQVTCVRPGPLEAGTVSEIVLVARVLVPDGTALVNTAVVGSGDGTGGSPGGGPGTGPGSGNTVLGAIPDGDGAANSGSVTLVVGASSGAGSGSGSGPGAGSGAAATGADVAVSALAGAIAVTLGLIAVAGSQLARPSRRVGWRRPVQGASR